MPTRLLLLLVLFAPFFASCGNESDELVGPDNATHAIIDKPAHVDQLPETVEMLWASKLEFADVVRACDRLPHLQRLRLRLCSGEIKGPLPAELESLELERLTLTGHELALLASTTSELSLFKCSVTASTEDQKLRTQLIELRLCLPDVVSVVLALVEPKSIESVVMHFDESADLTRVTLPTAFPSVLRLDVKAKSSVLPEQFVSKGRFPAVETVILEGSTLDPGFGKRTAQLPNLSHLELTNCNVSEGLLLDLRQSPSLQRVTLVKCTGITDGEITALKNDPPSWALDHTR